MSEIARWSSFDRGGENVAAGREQGPLAFRTQVIRLDIICGRDAAGPARQSVVWHGNRHGRRLAALCVENLHVAVHFIDNVTGMIRAGPTHVPLFAVRYLSRLAAGNVVGVDIEVS